MDGSPHAAGVAPAPVINWFHSHAFPDGEVVVNLAHRGEDGDDVVYFLDIYARSGAGMMPDGHELVEWQRRAHPHLRAAFEDSLTDACKQLFRGMK